ncbi:hypothetical protein G6F62_012831 [Rhizopus arrhizus]|nr:hypothetical protein G6F62_012831 [Rhizopus arrhizus]
MASGPCVRADRRLTLQLENSMSRLPSLYISHGSPMTALHPGQVGVRLAALAQDLPTPRAIVMASAHWLGRQPLVGAHPQPPTIHDFGGRPHRRPRPAGGPRPAARPRSRRVGAAALAAPAGRHPGGAGVDPAAARPRAPVCAGPRAGAAARAGRAAGRLGQHYPQPARLGRLPGRQGSAVRAALHRVGGTAPGHR